MIPVIQNSFVSGELSPSFLGRTDKPQYKNGAATMRNAFVRYTGGASSRAGFAYCGMCKQAAPNAGGTSTANPPRLINFQFNINQGFALEFGDQYMRILSDGAYVVEATNPITAITNANPGVFTYTNTNYTLSNGDWIFLQNIGGMTELNGLTWIVQNVSGSTFTLTDLFGNAVNTTNFLGYISGGTLARIYTVVSPYAAIDIKYLKLTENANLMNLVCWNQMTDTEYSPYTLQRVGNTNWVFTKVTFASAISPPSSVSASANSSTTQNTWYSYVVTAIDGNGNESIASKNADVINNDISINAGSNIITWTGANSTAVEFNVYAATPIFVTGSLTDPGFIGVPYGLIGSAFGQQFIDTNIIPDFTTSPPLHQNPFAPGQILNVTETAAGTNYLQANIGFTITTATGTGFAGTPIIINNKFAGFYIQDNGQNYAATDTIAITSSASGTGAAAVLTVGPQTGVNPGTVQYFQQRLVYADTINQPDTYFMSQPALYNNFDAAIPTVDSDAIIGTPWGVQINGIQFLVPSIQGLLAFTGNGVWLINGGNNVAITPSDQNAQAQAQVGCSALLPPMYINLHVLYVQAKNSIVRDISFNFLYNTFIGSDITLFSNHLFQGFTLKEWAYAEEPYKVVWAVRDDGQMLSLTYIKDQEIQGWSRHDTDGLYTSVCSVIEPPVDAIYSIAQRYITGEGVWAYYSERADNRQWANVEQCFCVDAGLSLPMTEPNATLTPAAAIGTNNISDTIVINGGSGYTNPTARAVDSSGKGIGATFSVTQVGGVIMEVTPVAQGDNYTAGLTSITISDPTGTGAIVQAIITNNVLFTASSAVFSNIQYMYVANFGDNTVSVIDYIDDEVVDVISVGGGPTEIAITPDGTQVWVINEFDSTISIINSTTLSVISTLSFGNFLFDIAITPNGITAYVVDEGSDAVYPITVSNQFIGSAITVGDSPAGICILPNGVKAYVTNGGDNTVTPITISSNIAGATINVGNTPQGIASTPDSAHVYVANSEDDTVSAIRTSDNSVIATVNVGSNPNGVAVNPSGTAAYVTNLNDGTVSVISTANNIVISTIRGVGVNPTDITFSLDGQFVYITDQNGQPNGITYIISALTNTVVGSIAVGGSPIGIAISPISNSAIGTIGDVIRVGGGKATITQYISSTEVMANIIEPITAILPNDPNNMPIPQASGDWSVSRPVTVISGLNHLEGMTVTGLADGGVIVSQIVTGGSITLQNPASQVTVGLPFAAQVQAMPIEVPSQTTTQGRRKDIQAVTLRVEASRGLQSGTNQPNSSWQQNQASIPWTNMKEIKERNNLITAGASIPLFTGDARILLPGDWNEQGMLAVQQIYPLPMNLLAVIPEISLGDAPS